jgi:hypothetical protein
VNLYQYNALDKTDQACVLWNKGVFLAERKDGVHKVALYQIDGFYVEVFYDGEENAIKRLRSFSSVDQLQPYLEK